MDENLSMKEMKERVYEMEGHLMRIMQQKSLTDIQNHELQLEVRECKRKIQQYK